MQAWQLSRQIRDLLAAVTWSDAPSDVVLTGGAEISPDLEFNFLHDQDETGRFPFARVSFDGLDHDPDTPKRIEVARFQVHVVQDSFLFANDADSLRDPDEHGDETVDGGTRAVSQGQGKTTGRGLDEIVGRLLEALNDGQFNAGTHGFQGEVVAVGPPIPVFGAHFVKRVITIHVYSATVARTYPGPERFGAAHIGGGTVNVAWRTPPSRYDALTPIVRRGTNPGDPAPTSTTGGTAVTVTSSTTAQATGLVTGQTYNFSIFFPYDETGSGTAERLSDVISVSVST